MIKLYYAPGTCALACWIALEWAWADYAVEKVDAHSEAYRKINPLGAVPAIDIGGNRPVAQGNAILQYIAERFGNANLGADEGLEARLEFNEAMAFLTGDLHPAFWPYFMPQRYTTASDENSLNNAREAAYARIDLALMHLDHIIGDSGHVYRSKRTVADAYAYVMVNWASKIPKSWRDYSHLAHFMTTMAEDKAVINVYTKA
ncbi:MAG: glutathione S-transferase family protein [Parahaliea sp.]